MLNTKSTWTVPCIAVALLTAAVSYNRISTLGDGPAVQRDQVVHVYLDLGRTMHSSSGVIVAPNHILTNSHAVRGYNKDATITVTLKDGSTRDAKIIKNDPLNDLALLEVSPVLTAPILPGKTVRKGDYVTICGFLGGKDYKEVRGKVVGWASPKPRLPDSIFIADEACGQGMSGGPAIADDGTLVGLLWGSRDYSRCVTIEQIKKFLKE